MASTLLVLAASASTLVALMAARPHVAASAVLTSGDDLAFASAWVAAVGCACWLTVTTFACLVALGGGCPGVATRIARFGPPVARRLLQTALVGTFAVLPAAAYATPSAPLVVHVGPGGRLVGVPGELPDGAPVVRTPPTGPTVTRLAPPAPVAPATAPTAPTTTTTSLSTSAPTVLPATPPTVHAAPVAAAVPATPPHTVEVRAGDNLWRIARAETARVTGVVRPDNRTVAAYWRRVIVANRSTLRSGDPGLIFPGELIQLQAFAR